MALIPEGFSAIPGRGRRVAQAIVKLVEADDSVSHGDITYSPTIGFIVPDSVAKKYKAPKVEDGEAVDDNSTASKTETLPPAQSQDTVATKADESEAKTDSKSADSK